MKTIYKYELLVTDQQLVEMPCGSHVLSVGTQGGRIYVWAVVDIDVPTYKQTFYILGTGNPIDGDLEFKILWNHVRFLGTVQQGDLVWHIFKG